MLWRGYLIEEDTSLDEEKLANAIDELVDRLEDET